MKTVCEIVGPVPPVCDIEALPAADLDAAPALADAGTTFPAE
jgi:hypothetical protein